MPMLDRFATADPQETDDIPGPIVAFGGLLSDRSTVELDFHQHRRAQLMLALHGVLTCEAAGGLWIVPSGRALWVPGGVAHRVKATGPIEAYNVFVEPDAVADSSPICCTVSVTPLLRELVIRAASFPAHRPDSTAQLHLAALLIDEIEAAPVERLHLPMPRDARLRRIFDGLMADPSDPRTTEDWARGVALSGRTLLRLIQRETGMSFGRWRQQLQIVVAIQLMADGASVQQAAFALGYESPGSFVTMFRKALGTPPGRFMAERHGEPAGSIRMSDHS